MIYSRGQTSGLLGQAAEGPSEVGAPEPPLEGLGHHLQLPSSVQLIMLSPHSLEQRPLQRCCQPVLVSRR